MQLPRHAFLSLPCRTATATATSTSNGKYFFQAASPYAIIRLQERCLFLVPSCGIVGLWIRSFLCLRLIPRTEKLAWNGGSIVSEGQYGRVQVTVLPSFRKVFEQSTIIGQSIQTTLLQSGANTSGLLRVLAST